MALQLGPGAAQLVLVGLGSDHHAGAAVAVARLDDELVQSLDRVAPDSGVSSGVVGTERTSGSSPR